MGSNESWQRFMELTAPFHDRAARTARHLCRSPEDGDDLFQEALVRAHGKLHTLRDESRFRSWFFAVLLSVHRGRLKRSFWRRFLSLEQEAQRGLDPAGEDGRGWEEERLRADRVSRALETLPAVQREAVVLFELEDFSIEEIADLQGASIPAVKSRLSRGRARLRSFYENPARAENPSTARKRRDRPLREGEAP